MIIKQSSINNSFKLTISKSEWINIGIKLGIIHNSNLIQIANNPAINKVQAVQFLQNIPGWTNPKNDEHTEWMYKGNTSAILQLRNADEVPDDCWNRLKYWMLIGPNELDILYQKAKNKKVDENFVRKLQKKYLDREKRIKPHNWLELSKGDRKELFNQIYNINDQPNQESTNIPIEPKIKIVQKNQWFTYSEIINMANECQDILDEPHINNISDAIKILETEEHYSFIYPN